jgi:peroxiredoxin
MTASPPRRPLRSALFLAAVLIVAAAGAWLGTAARSRFGRPPVDDSNDIPQSFLTVGTEFPDVHLVAEDGTAHTTHELLAGRGGVVMLLEIGCPPCSLMTARWQHELDSGALANVPVLGIAMSSPAHIRQYKTDAGLTLPIYSDGQRRFQGEYAVDAYPLNLVVSAAGRIVAETYDANAPIEPRQLEQLLRQ